MEFLVQPEVYTQNRYKSQAFTENQSYKFILECFIHNFIIY